MTRETFSAHCQSAGCRWARVYLRSRLEADELARAHARAGHSVAIQRETIATVATVSGRTP